LGLNTRIEQEKVQSQAKATPEHIGRSQLPYENHSG